MRSAKTRVARLLVFAAALSAIVVVKSASPAHACSCLPIEQQLARPEEIEAAFVGTVLDAPEKYTEGNSARLVTWTFRVDQVYVGELPATVTVKSAISGASCGFEGIEVGSAWGVLLRREGDDWHSGLCSSGPPAVFHVLGSPRPPQGVAAPGVVEPGDGGDARGGDGLGTATAVALVAAGIVAAAGAGALFVRHRRAHAMV